MNWVCWGSVRSGGEAVPIGGLSAMAGYWGPGAHKGPHWNGDIVRVRADGGFEYRGRLDQMVTVRGHRVELGEIEAGLSRRPGGGEAGRARGGRRHRPADRRRRGPRREPARTPDAEAAPRRAAAQTHDPGRLGPASGTR
ncbi:hypothetical protein [Streptomyces sp. NPDC003032]